MLLHSARRRTTLALILTAALGAGCAGDSATEPLPGGEAPLLSTVARVGVTPRSSVVPLGQEAQLAASAFDGRGGAMAAVRVAWTSLDPTVATVSDAGLVRALQLGTARIVARADGRADTATVAVSSTSAADVASIGVAPSALQLTQGGTGQLVATAQDAAARPLPGVAVTWTSANAAIASVSPNGVVTAIGSGSTVVTARANGRTAGVTVVVAPRATSMTIAPEGADLVVGTSLQLDAAVLDATGLPIPGRAITWSSSAAAVATVTGTGRVQAVGPGTTTIVARHAAMQAVVTVRVAAPVASEPVRQTVAIATTSLGTVVSSAGGGAVPLPGVLVVGDGDATGMGALQGIAVYALAEIPEGATIESATLPVTLDAQGVFGEPFALGALHVENAAALAPSMGAPAADARVVTPALVSTSVVDVATLVRSARLAGETLVAFRFRFTLPANADGVTDQLELKVGRLAVTWVK
jgi:uncharacterized protein YjdB